MDSTKICANQKYRQWLDSVRGRVGAVVRGPWKKILEATAAEVLAMYERGLDPKTAAARVVEQWRLLHPARQMPESRPDWNRSCIVCGQKPVVGDLELCGPCCFGEAETAGGNW